MFITFYSFMLEKSIDQKTVFLQCKFKKVFKVDTVNENYFAEIFLRARWREESLDTKDRQSTVDFSTLWNPKLHIENILAENKSSISFEFSKSSQGLAYIIEKRQIKGSFNEILELKHFPFDCQDLSITISSEYSSDEVKMTEEFIEPGNAIYVGDMESQEWSLYSHVEVQLTDIKNDCIAGPKKLQNITFTCRARRKFLYFLINHFLISSMFFLLTFTSFAIVYTNVYGRLQMCLTCLLTSVTFKVAVSQSLPKIPYLTYLDKTILGNIFMTACVCFWHAATSLFESSDNPKLDIVRRIEIIMIPCVLIFYGLAVIVFGLVIYFDAGRRRRSMDLRDIHFQKQKENGREWSIAL